MTNKKLTLEMIKHREKIERLKQKMYDQILDEEIYYINLALNELTKELNSLYNLKN